MTLRSINIARRASICFGMITLLLFGFAGFSYVQIDHLRSAEQDIETNSLPSVQVIDDIQIALLHARLESIRMLSSVTTEVHSVALARVHEALGALKSRTEFYREYLLSGEQDKIQFEKTNQAMNAYVEGLNQVIALDGSNHEQAIVIANGEQAQRASDYQEQLTLLREQNARQAIESGKEAARVYAHSVMVLIVVLLAAAMLTVILAIVFTRSIVSPITSSLRLAEDIAVGNLAQGLEVTGTDEAAQSRAGREQLWSGLGGDPQQWRGDTLPQRRAHHRHLRLPAIARRWLDLGGADESPADSLSARAGRERVAGIPGGGAARIDECHHQSGGCAFSCAMIHRANMH